jgi:hypothetical protein
MDGIFVGLIVGAAAIIMIRRFLKKLKPSENGGCGDCCSCGANKQMNCSLLEKKDDIFKCTHS